jgi:hypothetical protein
MNAEEEPVIELENEWKLLAEVPDAFEPLREDGGDLLGVNLNVTAAVCELVTEGEPLLPNESLEAVEGTVVGVNEDLGQGADLRRPIPSVRTMDENRGAFFQGPKRKIEKNCTYTIGTNI